MRSETFLKKALIIIILLFTCIHLHAQLIKKNDLVNFSWFTDHSIKSFYKSDTIFISRITDPFTEYLKSNSQYRELDYNNNNNITRLTFKKNRRVEIIDVDVNSWTEGKTKKVWKWKFNVKQQIISFYFDGKLFSTFAIREKLNDSFIWKYKDNNNNPKEEVYHLLLYKFVRLK